MAKKASRIRRPFTPQFKKDAVALVELCLAMEPSWCETN